jgi:hypothetical protein
MTDSELRGLVLQKFYEKRRDGMSPMPVGEAGALFDPKVVFDICEQLKQQGLLEWKGLRGSAPREIAGMGKITARGVNIIEGTAPRPSSIMLVQPISVHSSSNVQIGNSNIQGVHIDAEKLIAAINGSNAGEQEKAAAKSLLRQLIENPLVAKIIGGIAGG